MKIEIAILIGAAAIALTVYGLADALVKWIYPWLLSL